MADVNKRRRKFLSLSKLECSPQKSTPGKFAYIRHFQRIGINATKSEKTLIHFQVTFSLPSPSSMLKLPTEFAFLQSSSPLFQITHFVKRIRTLLKKKNFIFACFSPPRNVKLGIFSSHSCSDGKEMYKKA